MTKLTVSYMTGLQRIMRAEQKLQMDFNHFQTLTAFGIFTKQVVLFLLTELYLEKCVYCLVFHTSAFYCFNSIEQAFVLIFFYSHIVYKISIL